MKKLKLFFALFAMLALGVGNAWGAEETVVYTETFEDSAYKTSTTYNNSTEKKHGPTNRQWGVLCGTPNTGAHNGSKAFAMRYYKSVSKTPTLTQYFDINNVDAISFWSKTESTNNKLNVEYSTDGGSSWSSLASNISITTLYKEYSYNFSTQQAKVRLRFTMGTTTEKKSMIIDDIEFISTSSTGSGTEEPVLSVEPNKVDFGTKNIYFESEKQGSLEIEITGKNLTGNVTAALSGIDANIFDLSQESFTPEDGEVSEKLTVSYEVSEEKEYSATLTLSSNGVDNVELPITLTTINKKPTVYTKVTDAATLSAGDKVIFVYEAGKVAAGKLSGGYLTSIDIAQAINTTANPATVSITDEAVIEYTLGGTTGAWEFISASGKLSEASANSTKSVDLAYNKGTTWTIAISSGNATIKGATNTIQYNEANPRFKTYTSGQKTIQLYAISVPKYAVNFAQPEGGELIVKNGENAIVSGNTFAEGIKLTVIANPANGYEGGTVVVKDAVGNDVTATVYADGVLTMPAYAVTISATFEKKECTLLATPTVSATTTYNSATLSWGAVTKAAKYSVKIGDKDAVETTATSYEVTDLNAETTYTYQVQAIAEAGQDTDCDSEVAEGTFTTATAPVATVTLSDVDGEKTLKGSLYGTITLPKTAAECSKTFVGWDADENCNHAPTYAPGAEYTFTTQDPTLYAVYADENNAAKEEVYTFTSFTQANTVTIDAPESFTITLLKGSASTAPQWNSGSSQARVYAQGSLVISADAPISKIVYTYIVNKNNNNVVPTIDGVTGKTNAGTWDASTKTWTGNDTKVTFSTSGTAGNVGFTKVAVTVGAITYSNYSTTCAAAPIATVDPTSVTATVAGGNGKVEVTYENVNTENVSVALYNDAACTETFTADWLTASLDGDKNIAYTVAATTLYTERKAYIQLTAPETTGATEPAVVVIPVTQAGKDKVFASLEELVAAITPTMAGIEVTVTLTNEVIQDFYKSVSYTNGIALNVPYEGGVKVIEIYCKDVPAEWVKGGKVSGTITCPWKLYNSTWELCPTAWTELTYTAPATVSSIAVSGTPTKTTYIDGEKFDPAGLVVTATYSDASTGAIDAALVDWTFDPATLVKGQTSVSVTATFNSVSSAAYEVTGLTVNDIPTKTVAEFIAAGGTRCYLEGIVSGLTEGNSMKYGNFDLTDASGKIYVYGCLNAAGESQKFADLGVKNGDKIKVIADEYELYDDTKDEAINVQYVSHVSAATITIADITMEVGETKTIAATVVPAEATVTYTIKENAANAISLSGNTITALAEGTATITATVAEGATYLGNSVDFKVTVTPKSEKTNVVILAEYNGEWYAMTNACTDNKQMGALKVTYVNGVILDFVGDKASITWERAVVGNKATFKNNGKYLVGGASPTLNYTSNTFEWDVVESKYLSDANTRTFLFQGSYFKNYAISNAGKTTNGTTYSAMPVVTAVEFMNSVATPSVEKGIFSVADGKFVQFSTGNLQYNVGTNTWSFASEQYEVIGGKAYTGSNNTNYGMNVPGYTGKLDLFAWSCDGKFGVNPSNADADYTGTFADWGSLVSETGWYTLTKDEMSYLLNRKKDGKKLWAFATINDLVGLILLPDNWKTSITLEYGYVPEQFVYTKNLLSIAEWQTLEENGAVFLPAAGSRTGGYGNKESAGGSGTFNADGDYFHVDNVNIYGYYWLNTQDTRPAYPHCASYLILPGWSEGPTVDAEGVDDLSTPPAIWSREKRRGNSVRLVKKVTPNYTREVRPEYYGTICLENGGQMIGASLFELSYYNEAQGLLYMDEAYATMVAGNPYVFLPNERATNKTLYVFYTDEANAAAKTVNGLVGYLGDENMQLEGNGTNYILQDNKIKKVVGGNNSNVFVTKNRAYIQLGSVGKNEPAPVPGRRRVAIGQAPQVATGMENVDASAQPVKMIIDGQLYILRGEKMYDAQGKLVK